MSEEDEGLYSYPFSPDMMEDSAQLLMPIQASMYPMYPFQTWEDPRYGMTQAMYHPIAQIQGPNGQMYYQHHAQTTNGPTYFLSPASFGNAPNFITPHLLRRSVHEPVGYSPKQFHSNSDQSVQMQGQIHPHMLQQTEYQQAAPAAGPSNTTTTPSKRTTTSAHHRSSNSRIGVYEAVYSNIPVYEMMCNGVAVMRRQLDSYINATHILKVAGIEKGKRTKILEREIHIGIHEKVQGGYGKYQGTWIPMKRAQELAHQYHVADILHDILYLERPSESNEQELTQP
ncbi:transcriptional regulator swi6 [Nowakowskiella sp. JEL0407]|nr:transcriptional regulator swi6 [Nowakowskiella sp. JEL0407]